MPITFTLSKQQQATIIARTIGVDVSQVIMDDDGDGDVTITTDKPGDPQRVANMFRRWAKAPASDPKTN
jgi:hypothetical protein